MTAEECLARERYWHAQAEERAGEYLFVWEPEETAVVVGRGGRVAEEVRLDECASDAVPVLRRESGGGAVVLGRGCLNYTLILDLETRPRLRDVAESYNCILGSVSSAAAVPGSRRAENDLAVNGLKFSGCSQRRLRRTLLHHGTLLHDFHLAAVERYLREPVRRPHYRAARTHAEFLTNAPIDCTLFTARLRAFYPEAEFVS